MKPFLSSSRTFTQSQTPCKANSTSFSACDPPESCPTIATIRPRGGGISHRRCHAAGSRRHMGRLRAAAGSGSGAGRPASGLPQVGTVLLPLLPQIRAFPSLAHEPGPVPRQARIQEPVGGPEEPSLRCRSAPQPGRPGTRRTPRSAPSNAGSQPTRNAWTDFGSPVQSLATPSAAGGPGAAAAAARATAHSQATPGHWPGPADRPVCRTGWRPESNIQHPTSNIQHRTSNTESESEGSAKRAGCKKQ